MLHGFFSSGEPDVSTVADFVETNGYAVVEHVIHRDIIENLANALADVDEGEGVRRRQSVYAIRNLLDIPAVDSLSQSPVVRQYIDAVLGKNALAVRGILFDKTEDANWTVPWHQDLAIAVRERIDVEGYSGWSVKAGVTHVHPPAEILSKMLSIRLHLDDCGLDNGPLDVQPGSHRYGKLPDAEIDRLRDASESVTCAVNAGGVILMRPLLLHRSLSARSPRHRRVIHIEYADVALPGGLEWYRQAH